MNRGFSAFGGASGRRRALSPTSSIGLALAAERSFARRRQLVGILRHAFANAAIIAIHNEGWVHFTQGQDDLARVFAMLGLGSRLQLLERGVAKSLPF